MPHDTQCICQICICDIAAQTIEMQARFASEPQIKILFIKMQNIISEKQREQSETFAAANGNANLAQLHTNTEAKTTNDMRITWSILRRRNYESSIVFGNVEDNNLVQPKKRGRENGVALIDQKLSCRQSREYEDALNGDNKRMIKVGRRRDRSAETRDNIGLILQPIDKSMKYSIKSVYNDDYKGRDGDRFDSSKSFGSNVWKDTDSDIIQGDGKFIGESQTKAEFTPKKGERYEITRPQTSDLWKGSGHPEDETTRNHDNRRKRGERLSSITQKNTDITSDNKTSLPEIYTRTEHSAKTGKRYGVKQPTDSTIWKGDGSFISETQTATEFTAKKGERYDAKRPVESELWKKEGQMGSDTVSHQDYVNRTGERYPVTKPQDSDLLHGDGSFMSETQTATEFTAKKGERYDAKRPVESELWKVCSASF
ncbi:hypothetical protein LOAG_17272 [Loa loa]|uniref:Uncharacterized protein n=1 Tax=Loa loa TaxID=7209 RepID=A0A1S0UJA5_LOALO|nr:hypothetical protein LOAG_17272 [Loa loa]EJD75613.1 hypothetical protein LOAG_17272 [Loa loa]